MLPTTEKLWAEQSRHPDNRKQLFAALAGSFAVDRVLYPGSWCDVTASFIWSNVTYVDMDKRAARFFADASGVTELVLRNCVYEGHAEIEFIAADYSKPLPLPDESFDLLVSFYSGPLVHHCTRYLSVGGLLVANESHGDVAMASIDPRYELVAAIGPDDGKPGLTFVGLDDYLIPKKPVELTIDSIGASGRGVAYTKTAQAYVFQRKT